jgi:hypothetical protein
MYYVYNYLRNKGDNYVLCLQLSDMYMQIDSKLTEEKICLYKLQFLKKKTWNIIYTIFINGFWNKDNKRLISITNNFDINVCYCK